MPTKKRWLKFTYNRAYNPKLSVSKREKKRKKKSKYIYFMALKLFSSLMTQKTFLTKPAV